MRRIFGVMSLCEEEMEAVIPVILFPDFKECFDNIGF